MAWASSRTTASGTVSPRKRGADRTAMELKNILYCMVTQLRSPATPRSAPSTVKQIIGSYRRSAAASGSSRRASTRAKTARRAASAAAEARIDS